MRKADRTILLAVGVLGLFAAFWFLALAPKRQEAKELEDKAAQLQLDVAAQEAIVSDGREAQADYERNFSSLVVLGKAAPADGDTPGLLEQLVSISKEAKTGFQLLQQADAVEVAQPAAAETTADPSTEPPAEGEAAPATETAPDATTVSAVPATEASAASLPIGATVGSAGLGVLPYDVMFTGDFFQIADLFQGIDKMIESEAANVEVGGRLVTVNGFKMTKPDSTEPGATGALEVQLSISTYVLPESQGLTAGATSTAPPEAVPAATTPVAETTP
jgi:Tfp pilus assembly protein PilO